ncbi:hypothetical protein [Streptomyces sp. H27-D2]|uniref:hypothetical protein n=1 Tax=Streptomyces sp. H27-D2 TaxID=3046304 RepID=UPI002DB66B21|nr:hypothetical protein [Streptomyces sp. H27-D2]MEC4018438.1 hypothetical protein [Streptomyces sp. H27-D2]
MRTGLTSRSNPATHRAWWCEFTVRMASPGGGGGAGERARVRGSRARTPEQALVWMRVAVRVLLSGFDPEDGERAFRWLDHGQWEAVMRLKAGEPYAFVASSGSTRVEWSARPVIFLPVLPVTGHPVCGGEGG